MAKTDMEPRRAGEAIPPYDQAAAQVMTERTSGIYAIVNTKTHAAYIGSSVDIGKRIKQHARSLERGRHHSVYLQRAWSKTRGLFVYGVVDLCAPSKLTVLEQQYLDLYVSQYNCSPIADRPPSRAGRIVTAEERAATSARFKSIPRTALWRKRIGNAHRGKKISSAQIEQARAAIKEFARTRTGPFSEEANAKRASAALGRKHKPRARAKIAAARREYWRRWRQRRSVV